MKHIENKNKHKKKNWVILILPTVEDQKSKR